jgi:hypothetical protein
MLVQVCEMAAVMRMAVRLEEEREWEQRELLARLLTENKVASSLHTGSLEPSYGVASRLPTGSLEPSYR